MQKHYILLSSINILRVPEKVGPGEWCDILKIINLNEVIIFK